MYIIITDNNHIYYITTIINNHGCEEDLECMANKQTTAKQQTHQIITHLRTTN